MRISTQTIQQQSISTMMERQAEAYRSQQQLSSGKRILTPSDDPQGAARAMDLTRELETVSQFEKSAGAAESQLSHEELTLQGATDILQAARELAVRALNGTLSAQDRLALSKDARQYLGAMLNLANSRAPSGDYLFSGYRTEVVPFTFDPATNTTTYAGDGGQRQVQIGYNLTVAQNDPGDSVFVNVPGGVDVFQALNNFATALETNTLTGASLDQIDASLNHLLDVRGSVGARLSTIDRQNATNGDYKYYVQQTLSSVQDVDFAEVVSRMNQQLTNLQAIQQTYTKVQGLSLFNYI